MDTYNSFESAVDRRNENTHGVNAPARCEEQKGNKVGVVLETHTVIDPRTVVIHFHYTSAYNNKSTIIVFKLIKINFLFCLEFCFDTKDKVTFYIYGNDETVVT